LALAGDTSDNVPGVLGIGPKIAASLVGEFGSLEQLLEHVDQVKQEGRRAKLKNNIKMARLSRKLVDLERSIPKDEMTFPESAPSVADLRMENMNRTRLLEFYEQMGFRDMKRRVEGRIVQADRREKARPVPRDKKRFAQRLKAEIPQPEEFEGLPF
jgi:DNA polymerase-1